MFDAVYTETLSDLITDTLLEHGYTESQLVDMTRADRISAVRQYIFEDYPIFDEEYRPVLESKILTHFYLREIGSETPEMFLYYLNRELNEQAPYFNELYRSLTFQFNPLYTVNKTINHAGTGSNSNTRTDNLSEANSQSSQGNSSSTNGVEATTSSTDSTSSNSSGSNKSGFSDTPQGAVTGIENALTPNGSGYLTNASIGESSGSTSSTDTASSTNRSTSTNTGTSSNNVIGTKDNTGTQTNSGTSTDSYIDTVTGYESKPMELIKQFRDGIINVDMKVIKLLNSCFMTVY